VRDKIEDADILLDVRNDFCSGGKLAVPHGDEVVPLTNQLGNRFQHMILTRDWHPKDHGSFASINPGRRPFETVAFAYGSQVPWPDHCVQGTLGAQFHSRLEIPHAELIIGRMRAAAASRLLWWRMPAEASMSAARCMRRVKCSRIWSLSCWMSTPSAEPEVSRTPDCGT
jgi:nicotinamidase/pyrazinamidase